MSLNKILKMYPTFEEWVSAHRHSSCSVSYALEDALEIGPGNPIEALESYISGLEELRSEIDAEISEANFWIGYFKKQK